MRRFPLATTILLVTLIGITPSSASPNESAAGSEGLHDLINLSRDHFLAFEHASPALVEVKRCCHGESTVSVSVSTVTGSAQEGSDFTPTSKTVTFSQPVGADEVSIPLINDTEAEPLERLSVKLENATGGSSINFPSEADVTIIDNDGAARISMLTGAEEVFENRGPLELTVVRSGIVTSSATVEYSTTDSTATASEDYSAVSGTLSFGAGERLKRVRLTPIDDDSKEGKEEFTFSLSNPQGAVLDEPTTTVVTLADDEDASSDTVPPITAFHQPLDGKTYGARTARDVLIYAGDQGSGVRFVDFALQKKLRSGACSWYSRKTQSFIRGNCGEQRWIRLPASDVAVHTLPKGVLKPSTEGHRAQYYTATSRGIDELGNIETEFERTRNLNQFDVR